MDTLIGAQATTRARIQALRAAMKAQHLDAYIVPSADPHLSEYLPGRWQGREWLSGFNGSVGTLIVTEDFAGLWADGRYWSQAEVQLAGTGIALMKIPVGSATHHIDWLGENMKMGQTVGVDGAVLGLAGARLLQQALNASGAKLRIDCDLLQEIWNDRPDLPPQPVYEHVAPHAPKSRAAKLSAVREAMRGFGAEWHFISTLDDIAYLFNLRGSDVNYNPIFVAHALVGPERTSLFVADCKIDAALTAVLAADGVDVRPYAEAATALGKLGSGSTLLLDPRRITLGLRNAVPDSVTVKEAINPTTFAKSKKSEEEAKHVRAAMEQDGAALCEFFSWLESAIGREEVTELTIDDKITAARARRPGFVCPSFGTIAAFRANGAMPHYRATEESHSVIEPDGLLLIDSGAQYHGGTTDITRVLPIGEITDEIRRDCTLVMKGVIALSSTRYPRGAKSPMLDAIARAPIWAASIDYGHGTGHGVGYFLNVHEGPQVISCFAQPEPHTAMEPGMITSIEPGIYRPGKWGVRIENLAMNRSAGTGEFGEFLEFETLTLCPIDTRCFDLSLLRADEIAWLNNYHATVRARLSPLVEGAAKEWLEKRTAAI
jgi:Xaa-Pro aminopeptidase